MGSSFYNKLHHHVPVGISFDRFRWFSTPTCMRKTFSHQIWRRWLHFWSQENIYNRHYKDIIDLHKLYFSSWLVTKLINVCVQFLNALLSQIVGRLCDSCQGKWFLSDGEVVRLRNSVARFVKKTNPINFTSWLTVNLDIFSLSSSANCWLKIKYTQCELIKIFKFKIQTVVKGLPWPD